LILDAGPLISMDRGETAARSFLTAAFGAGEILHTTAPVLAQLWRDGAKQARLARIAGSLVVHPFDAGDYTAVGHLLRRSGTADVVDAHLVVLAARVGSGILTSDTGDLSVLAGGLGTAAPEIHHW
jgi:predicted nucleic acid-binding protein